MRLAEPSWLWIGGCACLAVLALIARFEWQRSRALARLVANRQLVSSASATRRCVKHALTLAALASFFCALARPQWGYQVQSERTTGIDLIVAVDTSKSMLAQDVRPSRLTRAKLAVEDLLRMLPHARVGLVAFAGDAFLQTPLTLDRTAFQRSLAALDTETIQVPGTDLESAVRVAEQAFASEPARRKVLVLLTDGEDLAGSAPAAARAAERQQIVVYPLGIGTLQGAPVPVAGAHAAVGWLHDPNGELVHSRLDEPTLRELARTTGGTYRALGASSEGLEALYREDLARMPAQLGQARSIRVFEERFQWPLGLGCALLVLEWLASDRRRVARTRAALALAGVGMVVLASQPAAAEDKSAVRDYNQAVRAYRSGDFAAAERGYDETLKSRDLGLQERAYYDRGNAQYREGQAAGPADVARQRELYEHAITSYEAALALDSQDADAKYNRDFVRAKLQQLEEQPKPSPKSQQPQQGGDNGQSQKSEGQPQHGRQEASGSERASAPPSAAGQEPRAGQGQEAGRAPGAAGEPKDDLAADGGERTQHAAQDQGQPAVPGGLTQAQAERLLDSLDGELRQLPSNYGSSRAKTRAEAARKDW